VICTIRLRSSYSASRHSTNCLVVIVLHKALNYTHADIETMSQRSRILSPKPPVFTCTRISSIDPIYDLCSTLTNSSGTISGLTDSNSIPRRSKAIMRSRQCSLVKTLASRTVSQTSFKTSCISSRTPDHKASIATFAAFSSSMCFCSGVTLGSDSAACNATKADLTVYALRTVEKTEEKVLYVEPQEASRALKALPHDDCDRRG